MKPYISTDRRPNMLKPTVRGYRPIVIAALALAGCSTAQVQQTRADLAASVTAVQAACKDALAAAQLAGSTVRGGAATTVASISSYITAGCGTAQAVASLAANSSSIARLSKNQGALEGLTVAQRAGVE
jgi:hypothetical protein